MKKSMIFLLIWGFKNTVTIGQGTKSKLPSLINHEFYIEDAPSISADKASLVYISNKYKNSLTADTLYDSFYNGIYISKRHFTGEYQPPVAIDAINTFFASSKILNSPTISPDGNMILFSGVSKNSTTGEDIFSSNRVGDTWSTPQNIGLEINSEGFDGFPSISPDGKKIFFAREIPFKKIGDQQCYKIWFSDRESINDKWKRPLPLRYPINQVCESSPRIHSDGKTLFFSSIRDEGKGDFDVYKSVFQDDGNWSVPINLKFINTKKADLYVSVSSCADLLYFPSKGDIYTSTIPEEFKIQRILVFQGVVTDSLTSAPLATQIVVKYKDNPNETVAIFESNISEGRYTALLSPDKKYDFYIKMEDYYPKKISVSQDGYNLCELINVDIRLKPFPKPTPASSIMIKTVISKTSTKQKRIESIKTKQ